MLARTDQSELSESTSYPDVCPGYKQTKWTEGWTQSWQGERGEVMWFLWKVQYFKEEVNSVFFEFLPKHEDIKISPSSSVNVQEVIGTLNYLQI